MKKLSDHLPELIKEKPQQSQQHLQESKEKAELTTQSEFTALQKKQVASALGECFVAQRTYGGKEVDYDVLTSIFLKHLSQFEPEKVVKALQGWMLKSAIFPTPHDIKEMIAPKPKFDHNVYAKLVKKKQFEGMSMTYSEREYIKRYEANVLKGA